MSKDKDGMGLDDFLIENVADPLYTPTGGVIDKKDDKDDPSNDDDDIDLGDDKDKDKGTDKDVKDEGEDDEPEDDAGDDKDPANDNPGDDSDESLKPVFELVGKSIGLELSAEDLEEYEDSEEGLQKLFSDIIKANSKPEYSHEEVEKFDEYVRKGGDPSKYLNTIFTPTDYESLDLKVEANQEKAVFDYYKQTTKLTDDRIKAKIEKFKDGGLLEDEASEAKEELAKIQTEAKKNLDADLEKENKRKAEQETARIQDLEKVIMDANDFGGLPVPKDDKKKFFDYLTKPDKTGKTAYQRDLEADKEAGIKMAYVKFKNFKFEHLEQKATTKVTKDLRKSLTRFTSQASKGGGNIAGKQTGKSSDSNYDDFKLKF